MADLTKYEQQAKLANNAPLSFTTHPNESPLSDPEIKTALAKALADRGDLQKVLIVPLDILASTPMPDRRRHALRIAPRCGD